MRLIDLNAYNPPPMDNIEARPVMKPEDVIVYHRNPLRVVAQIIPMKDTFGQTFLEKMKAKEEKQA